MSGLTQAFLLACLFAITYEPVHSIKCYVCHSKQGSRCADPFPDDATEFFMDCERVREVRVGAGDVGALLDKLGHRVFNVSSPRNQTLTTCFKMDLLDGQVTLRGCGDGCDENNPNISFCETCEEEGCNRSSAVHVFLSMLIGSVFALRRVN